MYSYSIKNSPKIRRSICDTVVPKFPRLCLDIKKTILVYKRTFNWIILYSRTAAKYLLEASQARNIFAQESNDCHQTAGKSDCHH